jgi:hypothetical protein
MANTLIVRDLNIKILILTSLNKKLCSQKVIVEKEKENDNMILHLDRGNINKWYFKKLLGNYDFFFREIIDSNVV